jgi:very-short-patch-repair endonuclease
LEDYNKELKGFSRELRKNMTDAERLIWKHIKGKRILGVQFYRQKIIENYIVDFYCPTASLVIEIDGGQHFEENIQKADCRRDKKLSELGLKVLRFNNAEVMNNIDGVLSYLYAQIKSRI